MSTSAKEKDLTSTSAKEKDLTSSSAKEKDLMSTSAKEKDLTSTSAKEKDLTSSSAKEKDLMDTRRLDVTFDVAHSHARFLGNLVLNLRDCGGVDHDGLSSEVSTGLTTAHSAPVTPTHNPDDSLDVGYRTGSH
nr:mitogen-activated protein kinase kinase kinase 13-like [Biomphalaria glabrata]